MRTEPIRWTALIAGLLAAVGPALVSVSNGTPVLEAAGVALAAFGLVVGGGELARTQAWSPASVEREFTADDGPDTAAESDRLYGDRV